MIFKRRTAKKNPGVTFDKYSLYRKAVQSPEGDVEFFAQVYRELRNKNAKVLREDFCGTFALCKHWVKMNKTNHAIGVDWDPEPMEYGKAHYLKKLPAADQKRVQLHERNVLEPGLPSADIAVALNFSYSCFKKRAELKKYFANVFASLNKNGIFILDRFGGSQCHDAIEDRIVHKGFTYYWDQESFDPVTHEALFHIHFRVGKAKHERVFTYDWRLWTIPELRELLEEVGFKKTHVYWEGTTSDGKGDGVFTRTEKGEACLSWIAYVVGTKG
ncbi:MAG TPA: class I SAM-dependent methyltransferase [Pseudobdellovibrionaceae bacterium]|nr:class I SAM-dependent methyltransferase [Pseudobdellovibrionaceae bacterium]